MKKIEKLLIVVVILGIAVSFLSLFTNIFFDRLYGPEYAQQLSIQVKLFFYIKFIIFSAVNIVIGIWLFQLAQKEGRPKWLWLILGLFLGLISVVLFYLIKVNEKLEKLQSKRCT